MSLSSASTARRLWSVGEGAIGLDPATRRRVDTHERREVLGSSTQPWLPPRSETSVGRDRLAAGRMLRKNCRGYSAPRLVVRAPPSARLGRPARGALLATAS